MPFKPTVRVSDSKTNSEYKTPLTLGNKITTELLSTHSLSVMPNRSIKILVLGVRPM
jgi:hypothetical protein